ncbi:MAG TPA: ferritin family protein [Terracidiphilus sp.]|nr:ferritin family protein [Terracidiphilus sp.]
MLNGSISIENEVTIRNLLAAFDGESNVHAKYQAFAIKADAEGLHGAASLFRAAARAEQIHADNHAQLIRHLGAEATATIHPIHAKSTPDNLNDARVGERYEIDSMYPEFLREAKGHNNTEAMLNFARALDAEKTHARLFSEAIAVLESGWLIAARNYYICGACGYTSETPEAERCPICSLQWEKFEVIR